jgi:hypothetical protein
LLTLIPSIPLRLNVFSSPFFSSRFKLSSSRSSRLRGSIFPLLTLIPSIP